MSRRLNVDRMRRYVDRTTPDVQVFHDALDAERRVYDWVERMRRKHGSAASWEMTRNPATDAVTVRIKVEA